MGCAQVRITNKKCIEKQKLRFIKLLNPGEAALCSSWSGHLREHIIIYLVNVIGVS